MSSYARRIKNLKKNLQRIKKELHATKKGGRAELYFELVKERKITNQYAARLRGLLQKKKEQRLARRKLKNISFSKYEEKERVALSKARKSITFKRVNGEIAEVLHEQT